MSKISMNTDSIANIVRKLEFMHEEIGILVSDMEKEIEMAEMEGWDDKSFFQFKDNYADSRHELSSVMKRIEEEHLVFLRRLLHSSEDL